MSYNIYSTPDFNRLFKKLYKKHPSLKNDLKELVEILKKEPQSGIDLGFGVYKIRLAISSKHKGKSGGARVITYVVNKAKEVYLVYIYDKSQLENISKGQILNLLRNAGLTDSF
jgi:hypothetical protein